MRNTATLTITISDILSALLDGVKNGKGERKMYKDLENALHAIQESTHQSICGTCKFHKCEDREWYCDNIDSDNYADFTGYEDSCEEWGGRK